MRKSLALLAAAAFMAGCGGGSSGDGGSFSLVQFLESGKNQIARNRALTFRFTDSVGPNQDLFERLKIQNVQATGGQSDFSRARGVYIVSADTVIFVPLLPNKDDRADSGFKENGNYHVFLKGGPDALESSSGDKIPLTQEFLFDTDDNFDDPIASEPPRATQLLVRDVNTDTTQDVSRLDPRPSVQESMSSADVIAAGNAIDPGAGGSPSYATPWQFELHVTEPLDPLTVTPDNVAMVEIRNNSINGSEVLVNFKVPVLVDVVQSIDDQGQYTALIRVRPIQTLVDNARYRLSFSGNVLGIDFRKQFIGDNGLTGDGQTPVAGIAQGNIFEEPGGLGYVAEFVVNDRAAISSSRRLEYEPSSDGINPESGQTTDNEDLINTALYDPLTDPGKAVGFLSAFGDGRDGSLAVAAGTTQTIDTGDVENPEREFAFTVRDLNPNDLMNSNTYPGQNVEWGGGATDNGLPTGTPIRVNPVGYELQLDSVVISSSATLRVIGKNPIVLRVSGIAQVTGTIDVSGGNGGNGGTALAKGGEAGAGGFPGGGSVQGVNTCRYTFSTTSCTGFQSYLNSCAQARNVFPGSVNGQGPGRGMAGGAAYMYYTQDETNGLGTSAGGGASHATLGTAGEDRGNGTAVGTQGIKCTNFGVRLSGYIGVRSQTGDIYGDRDIADVLLGGSGGGAAGEDYVSQFGSAQQAGGAGGGGGGSITIVASGAIVANGGIFDASGGNGGKGSVKNGSTSVSFVWASVTGGGGGGAGGAISLISGDDIQLTAATLTSAGGVGGARGNQGTPTSCNACNAGGDGGKGYIFLMDADGQISGYINGSPGDYDTPEGLVRVSIFDATRFSSIAAITELFPMPAADPAYQVLDPAKILGNVNPGQSIEIYMSSSYADLDDPLSPDLTPGRENPPINVAAVVFQGGGVKVLLRDPMSSLNPGGVPNREAFLRVRSDFDYTNGVEAALGPFASIDEVTIDILFNG